MPVVTPIYLSSAEFYAPRPYTTEIEVRDPGVTGFVLTDSAVIYNFGLYLITIAFYPYILEWSHRSWRVQECLDLANSSAILAGVPQDFGIYFWVNADPSRDWLRFRTKVQPLEDDGPVATLPPAPDDYWLPGL